MSGRIPRLEDCPLDVLVEFVNGIDNIREAMKVMAEWKIDAKGVKNLDQAKDKMIEFVLSCKPGSDNGGGISTKANQEARGKLLLNYQKAEALYKSLPPNLQGNLEKSFENVGIKIEERKMTLNKGESTILIAGEVGAGKSSLVNLLLGVQLFPTDTLRCTNTIVEIRCSSRKEAVCFFCTQLSESEERQRKVASKTIKLDSLKGVQEFKDCVVESNDDDNSPYDRIELYYPFKNISEDVVIVDTPGIEGGGNVDQGLEKYLNKAFGFIYVINTNTAGGVQQSRLGHLLKSVVNSSEDFSPEASLFIGNKWENIKKEEREDVKNDILTKLQKVYPGIKEKQIHYMSIKKCFEFTLKHKLALDEHKVLLDKVQSLIPNSWRYGLTSQYGWLSNFLKRTSYLIHATSIQHSRTKTELEEKRLSLAQKVEKLKKNTGDSVQDLRRKIAFEVYKITDELKKILKSKEMLDRLCDWRNTQDCPKIHSKWKRTADEAAMKISEKLTYHIDHWERSNRVLRSVDEEIVQVFSDQLGLMEHQIKEIEEQILGNRSGFITKTLRPAPIKGWWNKKKNPKVELTYKTLGGAVSCAGMLDTNKKDVRSIFRDMNERNKREKMAEATMVYLETILNHPDLQAKLSKFFSRFTKDIDKAVEWIPRFLQADEELIQTISQRIVVLTDSQYAQYKEEAQELCSKLDILYVNELMRWDYDVSEIDIGPEKLGHGSFADVFKAVIKRKKRPVAAKICRDTVTKHTISDILTEDRTMRDLQHPNVIRYYGATYQKAEKNVRWIMLLELCDTSLKSIYTGDDRQERNIPGLCPSDHPNHSKAIHRVADHSLQMCKGLDYIHSKGYTHRDMKLENVLMKNGVVLITDVGVAKKTNIISVTVTGSPAYMAPEVLRGDRCHSDKIDIYSLSIMFWEMWFGRDVTEDINKEVLGFGFHGDAIGALKQRQSDPSGGFRPSLSLANRPPKPFIEMLQRGWAFEPDNRPSAGELVKFFEEFIRNN